MAITNNSDHIKALLATALNKLALGEGFGYDLAWGIAPTPTGQPQVIYTIQVTMASPLLGQPPLCTLAQFTTPSPTAEQVEALASEAVTGLRKLASDILAQANHPSQRAGLN